MRYLKFLTVFFVFLALPACSTFGDLSESIGEAKEVLLKVNDTVDKVKPEIDRIASLSKEIADLGEGLGGQAAEAAKEFRQLYETEKAKADKDGDGDLSWSEQLLMALGVLGGGGVLARKQLQRVRDQLTEASKAGAREGAAEKA